MTDPLSAREILAASYRDMERRSYADDVEGRVRKSLAADPELLAACRTSWRAVESELEDRFRQLGRQPGAEPPKVFEVHHAMAVARECFLIRLDRGDTPDQAGAFTRERMGLTGDHEVFLARELEATSDPEPV